MWSSAAAVTLTVAVALVFPSVTVTVCRPAVVAVHTFAAHVPSGAIANVDEPPTSPKDVPDGSNPSTDSLTGVPAATGDADGVTTIRWSGADGSSNAPRSS